MAFAWTIPSERKMIDLFPSVIYVYTTCDTNNEGRPLLSMSGKDSHSRVFTFLRAFLPNQQMWVFRWVFCVLLPKMYGKRLLSKVQVVITDGDSQEFSQLDNAIKSFFPQVKRVRCGWHIVNRGWNSNIEGPKVFPKSQQYFYDRVRKITQSWI